MSAHAPEVFSDRLELINAGAGGIAVGAAASTAREGLHGRGEEQEEHSDDNRSSYESASSLKPHPLGEEAKAVCDATQQKKQQKGESTLPKPEDIEGKADTGHQE